MVQSATSRLDQSTIARFNQTIETRTVDALTKLQAAYTNEKDESLKYDSLNLDLSGFQASLKISPQEISLENTSIVVLNFETAKRLDVYLNDIYSCMCEDKNSSRPGLTRATGSVYEGERAIQFKHMRTGTIHWILDYEQMDPNTNPDYHFFVPYIPVRYLKVEGDGSCGPQACTLACKPINALTINRDLKTGQAISEQKAQEENDFKNLVRQG